MFKSLRFKFIFFVTIMAVAFVVIGSTFVVIDKRQYLRESLFKKASLFGLYTAGQIYEQYGGYYFHKTDELFAVFKKMVEDILVKNKDIVHTMLIDTKGNIRFDSLELTEGQYRGTEKRKVTDKELLDKIKELQERVSEGMVEPIFGRTTMFEGERVIELFCPVVFPGVNILVETVLYYVSLESISQAMVKTTWVIAGIAAGFIGLGVILAIFLANIMIRPIARTASMMREIAGKKGDLTKRLEVKGRDEVAQLALAFNELIKSIYEMVVMIRTTSEKITISSGGLSTTAQEMNASTVEISGIIQQVSKGVSEQASKIEATSRIMEDMSSSVKQVSSNAQAAAISSGKASETAQEGGNLSHQAVEGMTQISEVISSTAEAIKRLGGRSRQISEIVDILNSISDQTNLLALNAAIEAARAGEAGRGFAVVAEEVRKLAESSVRSSKDIAKLVSEIQTETTDAVTSMEVGTKEVAKGTKIVNEVGEALGQIVKVTQDASRMVNQIASATVQQLDGTQKVAKSVGEIALIAEESASAAQQATSSTQEQTASMEEMAASAQELVKWATDLKELVEKFKLEEEKQGLD